MRHLEFLFGVARYDAFTRTAATSTADSWEQAPAGEQLSHYNHCLSKLIISIKVIIIIPIVIATLGEQC